MFISCSWITQPFQWYRKKKGHWPQTPPLIYWTCREAFFTKTPQNGRISCSTSVWSGLMVANTTTLSNRKLCVMQRPLQTIWFWINVHLIHQTAGSMIRFIDCRWSTAELLLIISQTDDLYTYSTHSCGCQVVCLSETTNLSRRFKELWSSWHTLRRIMTFKSHVWLNSHTHTG